MLDVKGSINMSNAKINQCAEVSTIERCIRSARTRPSCIQAAAMLTEQLAFPFVKRIDICKKPRRSSAGSRPVPIVRSRSSCRDIARVCASMRKAPVRPSAMCSRAVVALLERTTSWLSVKLATPTSSLNFASLDCLRPSLSSLCHSGSGPQSRSADRPLRRNDHHEDSSDLCTVSSDNRRKATRLRVRQRRW